MKRFVFIVLLGFVLTACSPNEESLQPVEEEPIIEEKREEEKILNFKNTYPLTGIGTNEDVDNRPIAVTINNHPSARPQSGLVEADVVYEVLAEGEITRFVAIFQSNQPKNIGPIRSARGYLIELANGYDAFFITHGWSPEAQVMLEKEKKADYLQGLYYDGTYFQRSRERRAPHNSYITYDNAVKGLESRGYSFERPVVPLLFIDEEKETTSVSSSPAREVVIKYSNRYEASYYYDNQEKQYLRYTAGKQLVDNETENPVFAKNVFIVETAHQVVDNEGRRKINLTSGGNGLLLQNGVVQQVEWVNEDGRILPMKDGNIVPFLPGSTWINIVPTSPGIETTVEIKRD